MFIRKISLRSDNSYEASLTKIFHHNYEVLLKDCVKRVQVRSFFWQVFSRILTEYGLQKTPYLDTFHAVETFEFSCIIVIVDTT